MKPKQRFTVVILSGLAAAALGPTQELRAADPVGYLNVTLQPGLDLVANPLRPDWPAVWDALRGVPEGFEFYKFTGGDFTTNVWTEWWGWLNPDDTFDVGEAAFMLNPLNTELMMTWGGRVLLGSERTTAIAPGLSLLGPKLPVGGLVTTKLELRLSPFDNLYLWKRGYFAIHTYLPDGSWHPVEPTIEATEGFFVRATQATNWTIPINFPGARAADGAGAPVSGAQPALAQQPAVDLGTVNFANAAAGVDAPVTLAGQRVEGTNWQAELLWFQETVPPIRVGGTVGFATGALAGYFLGGSVSVPGVEAGQEVTLRVRVVSADGSRAGVSNPVCVKLGGGKMPPPNLVGLAGWAVELADLSARPSLTIAKAGQSVVLFWPGEFEGYGLESSRSLWPSSWQSEPDVPRLEGGRWCVALPMDHRENFFRLRR